MSYDGTNKPTRKKEKERNTPIDRKRWGIEAERGRKGKRFVEKCERPDTFRQCAESNENVVIEGLFRDDLMNTLLDNHFRLWDVSYLNMA